MAGDELGCPECGAEVYATGNRCMSCGAEFDPPLLGVPSPEVATREGEVEPSEAELSTPAPERASATVPRTPPPAPSVPRPSAPAVRRPVIVTISAIIFGLPGIAFVFFVVAMPPLAFITVPVAWFFLHGAECLYRGFNWARIAFMVVLGLLALGGVYLLLVAESKGPPALGIALCVLYIYILDARGAKDYCTR